MKFARRGLLLLSVLPPLVFLSACGESKTRLVIATPPAERLRCADEPAVPATLSDASVAGYIVDLRGAGQDCRSAVAWLRDWHATAKTP